MLLLDYRSVDDDASMSLIDDDHGNFRLVLIERRVLNNLNFESTRFRGAWSKFQGNTFHKGNPTEDGATERLTNEISTRT